MARLTWLVVVAVLSALAATSCVGSEESTEVTEAAQVAPNPTLQLCRSFVDGDPLDRPLANYVVYHWNALHPWVRAAADDYSSAATADHAAEFERQCASFLALLEG